ncbi:MAG: hypothetical protein ACK56I_26455, partial [bacterium]
EFDLQLGLGLSRGVHRQLILQVGLSFNLLRQGIFGKQDLFIQGLLHRSRVEFNHQVAFLDGSAVGNHPQDGGAVDVVLAHILDFTKQLNIFLAFQAASLQ